MDILNDLFITLEPQSWQSALLRLLALVAVSALLIWLLWLLFNQIGKRSTDHRDYFLPLAYLRSLTAFLVLFTLFFFFVIKNNGLHLFQWNLGSFYWAIGPLLVLYVTIITLFLIQYARYQRALNK